MFSNIPAPLSPLVVSPTSLSSPLLLLVKSSTVLRINRYAGKEKAEVVVVAFEIDAEDIDNDNDDIDCDVVDDDDDDDNDDGGSLVGCWSLSLEVIGAVTFF